MKDIVINQKDNVKVALEKGSVPIGHKIARVFIKKGEYIIKYGEVIGKATCDIAEGEWVHSHNMATSLNENRQFVYQKNETLKESVEEGYFLAYPNANGAGIRKNIFIIPTVGCINGVCKQLADIANCENKGRADGIFALTHQFGCSQLGKDAENITKVLCSIAKNPNASFVLFVGLGCENNALKGIKDELEKYDKGQFAFFNSQEVDDEIEYGMNILRSFLTKSEQLTRKEFPLSALTIGLKCGGSDGLSGITANPLVGKLCNKMVQKGANAILTEIPEMFGAEQCILNKCASKEVFDKLSALIESYKDYYRANNMPIYENPSPGNKDGGITTLEEKSLGCVLKGGNVPVNDVIEYGEERLKQGLSVLSAPGNDMIAATALAAAGCALILFTTGRGTPLSACVPTLKIASNQLLNEKKNNWIDFCAFPPDEESLYQLVMQTVNGEYKCKSESFAEIAFYKKGVTL
ncbi:MAG TPA: altronate dehydratase family protein [Clostridia bacterium]|nr:altronate dehydratase family protein [Clostridia bacterium]